MRELLHRATLVSTVLCGCKSELPVESRAPDELNRLVTSISAASVVSGFKHGRLRKEIAVAGFSISKRPITVEQFLSCVESGPCNVPTQGCGNMDGDAQDAALCVGPENAEAYCSWSGGRLPRLSEWLLAARGRSVQRFSWGAGAATCDQHPLARNPLRWSDPNVDRAVLVREEGETECGEAPELRFRVGRHGAGASPFGLEDVLIARGELLAGHSDSNFAPCMNSNSGCAVYGLIPGAIDSVRAVSTGSNGGGELPVQEEEPYSFRCVWSEEGV